MKRVNILLAGVLGLGVIASGVAVAGASTNEPDRPKWVSADGRADISKIPDDEKLPYKCWSGKDITITGKDVKKSHSADNAAPGSAKHRQAMAKMDELRKIPGVITVDNGKEIVNIDENNPEVVKVMQKYEAQETPQCK